jgi:hypothetical protein
MNTSAMMTSFITAMIVTRSGGKGDNTKICNYITFHIKGSVNFRVKECKPFQIFNIILRIFLLLPDALAAFWRLMADFGIYSHHITLKFGVPPFKPSFFLSFCVLCAKSS